MSLPLSLLVLATSPVQTPAPTAPETTLQDYIDRVLTSNLEAASERCNMTIADAQRSINAQRPDPSLTVGVPSKELYGPSKPTSPAQFNATLGWTLELGGKRGARIATARTGLAKAQADLDAFLADLRARAVEAYVEAVRTRLSLERKQKSLRGLREVLRLNEIRHRAGDIGGVELAQSRVEARRFEGDVQAAQAEHVAALAAFHQLLGSATNSVQPASSLDLPSRSFSLDALAKEALAHRPDLVAARRALEAAEAQERLAQANRWVDLGLSVGVNHTPPVNPTGLDASGAPFPAPALMSNALSFSVSVPLPFSRRQKGELVQAHSVTTQARLALQALELRTRGEVEAALAQVEATARQLEAYRSDILKDSDKVLEAMAFSYQRGGASLLEWLNAQRTNDEVYEASFEALAAHAKARAALDRVTGGQTLSREEPTAPMS